MEKKDLSMETEICYNCKREVPQGNYLMHVAHCARNMTVCPVCGEAVPKAHVKEHKEAQHTIVECPDCRFRLQRAALANHRATACGRRSAPCTYCELELPRCDMQEHETYCGARTERCPDCDELVMLKYRQLHLDSNHGFLKLNDEPGPTPSWEVPSRAAKHTTKNSLTDLSALNSALGSSRSNEINVTSQQPVPNKTDYKRSSLGDNSEPLSPRDTPRTLITPYDASEDLRAKVKLARHDLNEIKNSFMVNEDRRDKDNKYALPKSRKTDGNSGPRPRDKFVTNLVPYEKNESYKVNAKNLDEPRQAEFFNYLGAREPLSEAASAFPVKKIDTPDSKLKNKSKSLIEKAKPMELNGRNSLDLSSRNTFFENREMPLMDKTSDKTGFSEASSKTTHRTPKNTGALPKKTTTCNGTVPKRQDSSGKPVRRRAPPPPLEAAAVLAVAAPTVPLSRMPELDADEEEVRLPCEFCDKMVPASKLVLHETGCRPDLAQIQPTKDKPFYELSQPSPEVQLPCEFCLQLVPASQLLSHQALCDV